MSAINAKAFIVSGLLTLHLNMPLNFKPFPLEAKATEPEFFCKKNNFSSLFYGKTRLKSMIKTGKVKP